MKTLTIVQMSGSHGYLNLHLSLFWGKGRVVFWKADSYARVATLFKQIRDEAEWSKLFQVGSDTFHGMLPVW